MTPTPPGVTLDDLASAFRGVGLSEGDSVIIHSSFRPFIFGVLAMGRKHDCSILVYQEMGWPNSTVVIKHDMLADTVLSAGPLDILVNNAGVTHLPSAMEDVTEEDFDRVYNVNMKSVFLLARAFVPHFKQRKAGAILNVASTAGVSPRPRLNWYNASKGWMITATKAMAVELAPEGIRVNALNPVAGETPLLKSLRDHGLKPGICLNSKPVYAVPR